MDITELFRKLKFICYWANLFKDFERSNVSRVKLSSFSESDNTFTSLQALSNLHYIFSGFMDYFWSRKLNISNFGLANRLKACLRVFGKSKKAESSEKKAEGSRKKSISKKRA
ncbi:hypothetical protein Tco_0611630 [Tanacetum coccineum]